MSKLRQGGMTVAELLVAMTVGLGVLLGAGSLFVWAGRAAAAQMETAALDDAGRYALEAIARAVRQAGAIDWEAGMPPPDAPAALSGLDARSLERSGFALDDSVDDAVHGSDVLAVRFPGSGPPPAGDGASLDCAGFGAHRMQEGWSIFYVGRNAQGEAELRCKYRGAGAWSADAVIGAVDGFQVLYGLDADDDGTPERYVTASTLNTLDAGLVLAGAGAAERAAELRRRTHWKKIASVRVALLLHGPASSLASARNVVHELFGPGYGALAGDGDAGVRLLEAELAGSEAPRYRKVFGTTIALPARIR